MIPLRLPTAEELAPALRKLESEPGSLVIISIQQLETQNYHDVQFAWFNHDDRNAIKRAVDRARSKRQGMASKASDTPSNTNTADGGSEGQEEQP